jgi:hypothetical protein
VAAREAPSVSEAQKHPVLHPRSGAARAQIKEARGNAFGGKGQKATMTTPPMA